jgi:hypothetical protein
MTGVLELDLTHLRPASTSLFHFAEKQENCFNKALSRLAGMPISQQRFSTAIKQDFLSVSVMRRPFTPGLNLGYIVKFRIASVCFG